METSQQRTVSSSTTSRNPGGRVCVYIIDPPSANKVRVDGWFPRGWTFTGGMSTGLVQNSKQNDIVSWHRRSWRQRQQRRKIKRQTIGWLSRWVWPAGLTRPRNAPTANHESRRIYKMKKRETSRWNVAVSVLQEVFCFVAATVCSVNKLKPRTSWRAGQRLVLMQYRTVWRLIRLINSTQLLEEVNSSPVSSTLSSLPFLLVLFSTRHRHARDTNTTEIIKCVFSLTGLMKR